MFSTVYPKKYNDSTIFLLLFIIST